MQQFLGTRGGERVEPELSVVRLAAPAMVIFRTVVDEEQNVGHWQAIDQAVQECLSRGVDPVQVLHDHEQWLELARPQQQARAGLQGALAPLRGLERLPGRIIYRDVQERQYSRADRSETLPQCAEFTQDLVMDRLLLIARIQLEAAIPAHSLAVS